MRKLCLLIISIHLSPLFLFSQEWQCIQDSTAACYLGPSNDLWAVKTDSIVIADGYKNCYGFRMNRVMKDSIAGPAEFYCMDPFGPSRMGSVLSVSEAGNFFINSAGDSIRIITQAPLNSSWICCRISDSTRLEATINGITTESVLGMVDSVRSVSFQAKRNTGESAYHPLNGEMLKISKHFGITTLFDFYQFPEFNPATIPVHNLAGLNSGKSKTGIQNLTSREIYSMSPGDEFHIFNMALSGPHGDGAQLRTVKTVLDSTWNSTGDTVHYRCSRLMDYWPGTSYDPHQYSRDTITETWAVPSSEYPGLNSQPGQSLFYTGGQSGGYVTCFSQYRNSDYNSRWIKEPGVQYQPCSYCADTLVGYIGGYFAEQKSYYYIEGCGSGYYKISWTDLSHDTYSTYNLLSYFKKGSETWGTPFDTTFWKYPNSEYPGNTINQAIHISPNPAINRINVSITGQNPGKYRYEIYSVSGLRLVEGFMDGPGQLIDISNLNKGIYLLKVNDSGESSFVSRFIKE